MVPLERGKSSDYLYRLPAVYISSIVSQEFQIPGKKYLHKIRSSLPDGTSMAINCYDTLRGINRVISYRIHIVCSKGLSQVDWGLVRDALVRLFAVKGIHGDFVMHTDDIGTEEEIIDRYVGKKPPSPGFQVGSVEELLSFLREFAYGLGRC